MYDFASQQEQWSHPPVDDVGYLSAKAMAAWSDEQVREMVEQFQHNRYTGWRNHNNLWRSEMGLDTTHNKIVMDFGCGVGIEALQFAKGFNRVILADISEDNLRLARRVLGLYGYKADVKLITYDPPFIERASVDVFYCNGVLHHIPYADEILHRAVDLLTSAGEIRLLLYSDKGWEVATNTPAPPVDEDVTTNPNFKAFVRFFDGVGDYADWYSEDKVQHQFGHFLTIKRFAYITSDHRYCVAILKPR